MGELHYPGMTEQQQAHAIKHRQFSYRLHVCFWQLWTRGLSQWGHWTWLIQYYSVDPCILQTLVPNFDTAAPSYTHSYGMHGCCLNLSETRMWKIHIKLPENWSFIAYKDNKRHLFVQDLYSFSVQCFFQMTLIRLSTLSLIFGSYISLSLSL